MFIKELGAYTTSLVNCREKLPFFQLIFLRSKWKKSEDFKVTHQAPANNRSSIFLHMVSFVPRILFSWPRHSNIFATHVRTDIMRENNDHLFGLRPGPGGSILGLYSLPLCTCVRLGGRVKLRELAIYWPFMEVSIFMSNVYYTRGKSLMHKLILIYKFIFYD